MSTNPGQRMHPEGTAITSTSLPTGRSRPTAATRSPSRSTSRTASIPCRGSTRCPPLSNRFMFSSTRQEVQDRHANGPAVGHLVEDHRVRAVGHLGCDLDPPDHWTRVHDQHVSLIHISEPTRLGMISY